MTKLIDRWFDSYFDEDEERVCADISDKACREVPRNFFWLVLTQVLTKFADLISNTKTVLPWLLTSVGAPSFLIGMLVPIRESGSLLPQILIGGIIRRYTVRKWVFVFGSLLQGMAIALMTIVALQLNGIVAGITILGLLVLFSLARGFSSIASKDVLGKTVPKSKRGRLGGLATFIASGLALSIGVGIMLGWLFTGKNQPLLLGLAALLWLLAAIIFSRILEYKGATEGGINGFSAAKKGLHLLRDDTVFRRFVVARSLMLGTGFASPFIILLVQQNQMDSLKGYGISTGAIGLFIVVDGLAGLLSSMVWGKFSDISSRNVMLYASSLSALTIAIASLVAYSLQGLSLSLGLFLFFVLSIAHHGIRLGRKTYIIDIAQGDLRTEYVAVSNTLIGVMLLLLGILSASVAQFSIEALLGAFALMCAIAFLNVKNLPEA